MSKLEGGAKLGSRILVSTFLARSKKFCVEYGIDARTYHNLLERFTRHLIAKWNFDRIVCGRFLVDLQNPYHVGNHAELQTLARRDFEASAIGGRKSEIRHSALS